MIRLFVVFSLATAAWGAWALAAPTSKCGRGWCTVHIRGSNGAYQIDEKELFHTSKDGRFIWRLVNLSQDTIVTQFKTFQPACPGRVEEGEQPTPCEPMQRGIPTNGVGHITISANADVPSRARFKFDLAVGRDLEHLQVIDPELEIDRGMFQSLYPILALLPLLALVTVTVVQLWRRPISPA